MTQEEMIKLYARKYIQDKRGEWRVGDKGYDRTYNDVYLVTKDIANALNDPETEPGRFIWLPLPIDPINPERGLWGMVDWKRCTLINSVNDGQAYIDIKSKKWHFVGSITEALLRAIWAQQEVA
jgi:hypothetical protein